MREEKRRKEEDEKAAWKRAEEEERRRREKEEARMRAEEEEEKRRIEDEKARIKAAEEEAKARAEKDEIARVAEEAEKNLVKEPQTREDPDIELITEEMLDDNLAVSEMEEEVKTSSHREDKQDKREKLNGEDIDLELNGTPAEAGPQLEERDGEDDLENRTPAESDSTSVLSSDGVFTVQPSTTGEELDKKSLDDNSTLSDVDQSRAKSTAVSKGQLSRSQEKRELRRQRGLEHNQRETERASSSVSGKDDTSSLKNKTQATRLKERSESKELDQYTFVAWKMKEDKAAKKETKTSPPAGPVRPSTLSLQHVSDRNGVSEGTGAVGLQRRPGAIKEKPEKWRGRRSDGELSECTSPPQSHSREERRTKTPLYVFSDPLSFSFTSTLTGPVKDIKTADSHVFFFFPHLFIHSVETGSSSVDSLSPGSEGAGALQVLSFYVKGILQANFSHIIHQDSVVQLNSPSESLGEGSKGGSFRRKSQEGSGHQDPTQSIPSTPDRYCTALTCV